MVLKNKNKAVNAKHKDTRICIIGAGPGGLSAAEALAEKGYTNVVILEKSGRVGGQALSLTYKAQDGREIVYEVGSIQPISTGIGQFGRLIKKYNMHISNKSLPIKSYSLQKKEYIVDFSKSPLGFKLTWKNIYYFLSDASKLTKYLFKYRALSKTGFTKFPESYLPELSEPYEQWIDKQQFKLIDDPMKYLFGIVLHWWHPENRKKIPLMKFFKAIYQFLKFPPRYLNGKVYFMQEGYQELWNRIAKNHKVKLKSIIKKISRTDNEITIELEDETIKCDQLIISCLPGNLNNILDITPEEDNLFSKIICSPAWRVGFIAKNLPTDGNYNFVDSYYDVNFPNRLMIYFPITPIDDNNAWLFSGNIAYTNREGINEVLSKIENEFKQSHHAEIINWVSKAYWPDFAPFFSADEVKNGIYFKLEALQGKNNTYYASGLLSGASHALVINYVYELINNNF